MIGDKFCKLPPDGWSCSREPEHVGPCAATSELEYIGRRGKEAFYLTDVQSKEISEWSQKHDLEKHMEPGETFRYSGAIGGAYTYSFTPTSLGDAVTVQCTCGEEINVSHYEDW